MMCSSFCHRQGTANRKMAATYMNSESSRSHSVFTCIVESQWEKDSLTHLRFARLNLVDLAGSERQKSSGAEGDRLKEAASINKSLSTLGLVIMSLVDLAHGKHKHVPYRDSRLTFLLQDSLGGNSKTTVIANVSPSICSGYETLSTLKFAQRAKLIQNDAKINEDASGNVTTLQRQIQQLKGQLSFLLEQHHMPSPSQPNLSYSPDSHLPGEVNVHGDREKLSDNDRKMKCLEAILVGTIRREKLAERTNKQLEEELDQANLLAQKREVEVQKIQRMLKLSGERISQLELLEHGSGAEKHLIEETNVPKEETQLLKEWNDTDSELTRLQMENSRLVKQLSLFQEFYEQGERKKLLVEISELRDQLLETLEQKHDGPKHSLGTGAQDIDNVKELKECKYMNSKLIREVDELGAQLEEYIRDSQLVTDIESDTTIVKLADDLSPVECSSMAYEQGEEIEFQNKEINGDLENMRSMIMDSLVIQLFDTEKELEDAEVLSKAKEPEEVETLHSKLDQLSRDLENAQLLNHKYHEQQVSKLSEESQAELVREQVEMETAKTILQLQEDISSLQSELGDKLCYMTTENLRLKKVAEAKDDEMRRLCNDWELATLELTNFLTDGSRSLNDASCEIQSIASSFPCVNGWLNDHVESAAKVCLQKEETIILLQKSLEDAQKMVLEMEQKLNFLKEAAIVFSEVQKEETNLTASDAIKLAMQPNSKLNSNECLENKHVLKKDHVIEAGGVMPMSKLATTLGSNSQHISQMKDTELATQILKSANAIVASIEDIDGFTSAIQSSIIEASSFYREFSGTLLQDIFQMREEFKTMKENIARDEIPFVGERKYLERNHCCISHGFEKKLEEICREFTAINSSVKKILHVCENPAGLSRLEELDGQKAACTSSNSDYLEESICSDEFSKRVSRVSCIERTGRTTEKDLDTESDGHLNPSNNYKESEGSAILSRSSFNNKAVLLCLKEEIEMANDAANYLHVLLAPFINEVDKEIESARFCTQQFLAQPRFCDMRESVRDKKLNPASCITKLEEVYAAMSEADNMLKSLLKANKTANNLADMWKMECNELMVEKESLTIEIEKLQSLISVKDSENEMLQNHINCSLKEINYAVSSLEGTFQQMQTELVEILNADYANVRETVEGTLNHICKFRSFLEDICVMTTENGFLFVLMSDNHKRQFFNSKSFTSGPCGSMLSLQRNLLMDKKEKYLWTGDSQCISSQQNEEGDQRWNEGTLVLSDNNLLHENHVLKKELERKDDVLKGLFFDFSLLQEATATTKDYKDERERLLLVLRQVQKELMMKTSQVNGMLDENIKLKSGLTKYVRGLDQAEGRLNFLSEENEDLSALVKDLQTKNSEFLNQLVEQSEVVKNLENEILRLTCSADEKSLQSMMGDLRRITVEREDLQNLVASLQDKLDMACSFADENEAIATEARQESEESKVYAEQKEEEVKILEHSVEELESTINILENKVLEMEEGIENQRLMRDSLEYELEELKERMITVETFAENIDSENSFQYLPDDQISRKHHNRSLEHQEMSKHIRILEEEKIELIKEIKQYKEYISEVILHTEAQSSQYQEKYTILEAMIDEVKTNAVSSTCNALTLDRSEKSSRPRGSSSPFRCITNLVQQTNMEMDRELSDARLRIQELEELLNSSQKQVCVLSTRLSAAESMTHDVIRDLLGVKMDITNYANMIDQHQLQRLVEESQQQMQEFIAMKEEISNLKEHIDGLLDQRERYISEAKRRQAEIIATHITIEQLEEHDRLLTLQNEMLRVENGKLQRRISEMDERLRKLFATQNANAPPRIQKQFRLKENGIPNQQEDVSEMSRRVEKSRKLLSQVNMEPSSYHK
ncbi:kinesin-like protein KIN-12C isoform X2 [Impatiens glandulifera]|uniref:kinesin-like protein KIN-12C isoform X2 n=1 Tax=Impatiens glandulifera TaxID=253017 RepID=UPI001FB16965|nr:kinesin-like protein KIN-12C isoform X2 [Impatiens glandulifera]